MMFKVATQCRLVSDAQTSQLLVIAGVKHIACTSHCRLCCLTFVFRCHRKQETKPALVSRHSVSSITATFQIAVSPTKKTWIPVHWASPIIAPSRNPSGSASAAARHSRHAESWQQSSNSSQVYGWPSCQHEPDVKLVVDP